MVGNYSQIGRTITSGVVWGFRVFSADPRALLTPGNPSKPKICHTGSEQGGCHKCPQWCPLLVATEEMKISGNA